MHKYLKLIYLFAAFSILPAFALHAEDTKSSGSNETEEEKEEEEAIDTLIMPNLIPSAELSGIESNSIINFLRNPNRGTLSIEAASVISTANVSVSALNAIASSGVASSEIIALGSTNLSTLATKLTGTASEQAAQFKTLVNVVDAYSNVEADPSTIGRRAIATGADITAIVGSTVKTVTTDHLSTLSKLDTSHMKTFAGDGIANIDNFVTRVDVTSAMVGDALSTINTQNITSIVENLHASLDGDSLTALKSLEKSHMTTLVGSGDKKIDLTKDFTASTLKQSVKKFATKAEVTIEFAKASAPSTGANVDLSKVDIAAIATNIHANLDDDHLSALQQLSPTHMASMATGVDITSTEINVASTLTHFATKAEVVVEFAKIAAPTATADASGSLDFSSIKIDDFVTNIHKNLDADHTAALANLDPKHMATMAAGTDLSAGLKVDDLTHFATKAEVVVEFAKVAAPTVAANAAGKFDFSAIKIDDFVTTANTLDTDSTKALAKLAPSHMATMAQGTDLSAGLKADDLSHFATKGELASVYVDAGGSNVDIASIVTKVHTTITVEFTTSLKEFDPTHMATMATGVDIASIASVGHKAKVAHAYKDTAGTSANIVDILNNVQNINTADLLHFAELDHTSLKSLAADVDITKVHEDAAHKAKAVAAGYSLADALALEGDSLAALAKSTKDELAAAKSSGKSLNDHAGEAHIANTKVSDNVQVDAAAKSVKTDAKAKGNSYTNAAVTDTNGFPKALESAVKIAEMILTDKVINNDNDLASEVSLASLAGNGYNTELIRILAKYGALGSKGGALADAVLGAEYTAFNKTFGLASKVQPNTTYYQQFLGALGARAMGPSRTSDPVHESLLSVSTHNIKLSPGANITFNASAEIDASDVLAKGDRRIAIIGAAKDMTIKGDLNIKNTNKSENGVFVLGAADDLYFRSEYKPENFVDYSGDPSVVSVNNEGANLAIGAEDTMHLVNVSISTGGNLAIGTLNELHIGTSTAQQNSFSVGTGGQNSDPDNIYLYAHNLIQVNGLNITGRVDDVYMEAVTINLRNVTFPQTSEVTLRSRDGTIGFNQFANPIVGGVNLTNVKHGANVLEQSSFNGIPGNYATNKTLPNGTPAVQIKKF